MGRGRSSAFLATPAQAGGSAPATECTSGLMRLRRRHAPMLCLASSRPSGRRLAQRAVNRGFRELRRRKIKEEKSRRENRALATLAAASWRCCQAANPSRLGGARSHGSPPTQHGRVRSYGLGRRPGGAPRIDAMIRVRPSDVETASGHPCHGGDTPACRDTDGEVPDPADPAAPTGAGSGGGGGEFPRAAPREGPERDARCQPGSD